MFGLGTSLRYLEDTEIHHGRVADPCLKVTSTLMIKIGLAGSMLVEL